MQSNVASPPAGISGQLAVIMSNLGEFTKMLDRLNDRAPAEIRPDMQAAVAYWQDQKEAVAQAASDPVGAILAAVVSGLFSSASLRAVDAYATEHCGTSVFGTGSTAPVGQTAAPGQPTTPPAAGPSLDGRLLGEQDEIASDGVHAVVVTLQWNEDPWHPQPFYETYDVVTGAPVHARSSPGEAADAPCGFALIRSGDRSLILDMLTTQKPAEGIVKGRRTHAVRAIDAATMGVLWTVTIADGPSDEVELCNPAGYGLPPIFSIQKGRYLVFDARVIDVASGRARVVEGAKSAIGDWVAVEKGRNQIQLLDPASNTVVGTLSGWGGFSRDSKDLFGGGVYVSRGKESELVGYALPGGKIRWATSYDPTSSYVQYDAETNAFVLSDRAYGANEVLAVSAADGRTLWGPIDTGGVCGVDKGRVVVAVNGQLAILSVKDGSQLSFDPLRKKCPEVLPGLLVSETEGGRTVQLF